MIRVYYSHSLSVSSTREEPSLIPLSRGMENLCFGVYGRVYIDLLHQFPKILSDHTKIMIFKNDLKYLYRGL